MIVEQRHRPLVRQEFHNVRDIPGFPPLVQQIQERLPQAHQTPEALDLQLLAAQIGDGRDFAHGVDHDLTEVASAIGLEGVRDDDVLISSGGHLVLPALPCRLDVVEVEVPREQPSPRNRHVEPRQEIRQVGGLHLRVGLRRQGGHGGFHVQPAALARGQVSFFQSRTIATCSSYIPVHRIQDAEQRVSQLRPHLSAIEPVVAQVGTASNPVSPGELAQAPSAEDRGIRGLEIVVHDKPPVVDQPIPVHRIEHVRIHIVGVCGDQNTARQLLLDRAVLRLHWLQVAHGLPSPVAGLLLRRLRGPTRVGALLQH
mmetsp:Transcript_34474/g.83219  ORF Transcript_34474/g.83219 Transcript_34474/m.83219 type:complete len:313 (-) Transcript_34474:580-1518(-)